MSLITAHASPFSGQWYPEERDRLESLIDACIEESGKRADPGASGDPFAFVVPHAGIVYSGTVAGAAFRHLAKRPHPGSSSSGSRITARRRAPGSRSWRHTRPRWAPL